MTMTLTPSQQAALEHLRAAYIGPEQGENETLINRPSLQYAVGMLFPQNDAAATHADSPAEDPESPDFIAADVEVGELEEEDAAPPLAEDWRPSSAAISFVTDSPSVVCEFNAGTYTPVVDDGPPRWSRAGHSMRDIELSHDSPHRQLKLGEVPVEIGSRWRPYRSSFLVTVHVRVRSESTGDDRDDIARMIFQVGLSVRPAEGARFLEYDMTRSIDVDPESRELRLRYRDRKVYAVGHGMAAGWDSSGGGECRRVYLDPVPAFVVPAIETTGLAEGSAASRALDLAFLASIEDAAGDVVPALESFVDGYEAWAKLQESTAKSLGEDAQNIASRSLEAAERMRAGVHLLSSDEHGQLKRAFALGMTAMRLQMRQAALGRQEADAEPAWRPFQLGFVLTALSSTVSELDPARELVDLIWFPTGGGKTEAYLGLAAIEIFRRRLAHGTAGGGTAVITRYTLRLLTSQQFQRAASLVCAMELLRAEDPRVKGMAPFTIGLWVGNEATPGTRADAKHALERLYKARSPQDANEFQVTECPWCLTELVPRHRDTRSAYGAQLVGNDVIFTCTNNRCEFSRRELPMSVVDEVLYDAPPTILLATVDKFARLQFNQRAGRLLGIDTIFKQPSLIIQDELHLLSGPLGTTVAVFDAVIQLLLRRSGTQPKIVASTATIRASEDQVRGLYGRKVALYPPAGLDGDTTFFSRPVESGEGRLYIGLMPQSVSQASALVAATAPLLEIPHTVAACPGVDHRLDPYWTLVMYHNSLRELGRSGALLLDDIDARLEARADRLGLVQRPLRAEAILELTSRRGPEELPKDLRALRASADQSDLAIDAVLSSNMLSVGIDVQRLALMLMVGQPKTTAEYIQATSRVGRGKVKGVIVTLFRSNRARDRSHFETFRSYHDALYRSVEPTSVTPWSLSSRDRSLAGALVALVRHSLPSLGADASAGSFDLDNGGLRTVLDPLIGSFLALVAQADKREADEVRDQVWTLLRAWDRMAKRAREDGEDLRYERRPPSENALLKRFGQTGEGWTVADSMRSVEPNVAVEVQEPLQEVDRAEDPA
ncbi:helicase-related protein [Sinomonas susongensis]|uniref:helicase-related protein n=1 Tax=Sinomonas susongensis TaxID=1324851 RepID=UPI001BB201E0|nr:helicase-related protein [Sinomonas susongensis]